MYKYMKYIKYMSKYNVIILHLFTDAREIKGAQANDVKLNVTSAFITK